MRSNSLPALTSPSTFKPVSPRGGQPSSGVRTTITASGLPTVGAFPQRAGDGSVLGVRVSRKKKLNCFAAGLRLKVRKRRADESNAFRRWEYRSDEAKRQLTQLLLGSDRHFHRTAAGRNLKVGPFDFHRDRSAPSVRLLAPSPDIVSHRNHAGLDLNRVSQVLGECRFRSR
jgi:hypothetical protein